MIKSTILAFAFAAAIATPASAFTAYMSSTGAGSTCTLASPCNNINAAISVAGASGEAGVVVCLDHYDYSGPQFVAINASITISCGDGLWQGVGTALTINPPAGSRILIEGFVSDGHPSVNSISFTGQGTLELLRTRVGSNANNTNGVNFAPTGPATLHVSDSVFYNTTGSGILIRPTGNGYANVHMRNVKLERNVHGIFIDGSASTVGINVHITDSLFAENSGNGIGAYSTGGGAGVTVSVKDSHISGNLGNGIGVLGAAASGAGMAWVVVGSSLISGNVNGLSASSAGKISTFGNNQVLFNGNNGTFTGSIGLQ